MREKIKAFGKKNLILLSLMSFFVAAFPFLFLYSQNAQYLDAKLSSCLWPFIQCVFIFFVSWIAFFLISANIGAAYLLAIAFQLFYVNYMYIQNLIRSVNENWRWWQILPSCIFLFISIAIFCRYIPWKLTEVCVVFSGAFLVLCVINLGLAVPDIVSKVSMQISKPESNEKSQPVIVEINKELPNVYYFILDEHIRSDYLYKHTGEDLSKFEENLKKLGFNISTSSYSSATQTAYSVPNYLSFDNNFLEEEEHPNYKEIRDDLPLLRIMKQAGYYITTSSVFSFITGSQYTDRIVKQSTAADEWDIGYVAMKNSVSMLFEGGEYKEARKRFLQIFTQFEELYLSDTQPTFVFAHLRMPHQPFLFTEDGSAVRASNVANEDNYLGQVRWTDLRMYELVKRLIENDSNCIILIQSDHGMRGWATEKKEAYAIINYLYYQGKVISIEGLSGVNTIRVLLNYLFDMGLEMVEDVI